MRCLWLSGDIPYPTNNGRRLYSAGLCTALDGAGADIVALGLDVDGAPADESAVEWQRVPPAASASPLRKLASRWPSSATRTDTPDYRRALDAAVGDGGWDVAVIDHLSMSWAVPALRRAGIPVAYVSHNHEASVRGAIARHVPWRDPAKAALLLDARRTWTAERYIVTQSTLVTAITESDAARFLCDGAAQVLVVTPGYSGTVIEQRTIDDSTPRVAVLLGSLLWRVKRANVRRLVQAAEPLLARARIELRIVGVTPPGFAEKTFGTPDAVRFLGPVDDVGAALAAARVGIICERDGGGFKLKALDYVFHRVPMVVLDGSMEGLPLTAGVEYAKAPIEERLAERIVELVDDPAACQRMQQLAFDRCATHFDWSTRGKALAAALDRVVGSVNERAV